MNLDFHWKNYHEQEENHHDKEFPPQLQGEEYQFIYSSQTFQNMPQNGSGENLTAHKPKSKKTKSVEYAKAGQKMGMKLSAGGDGEIIKVEGGHIIRATGRKDRHSKVCTSKGPRDRRVRLAAHTAIQFYDVQDRLGYDRPSKAVDWLMKKAKDAIHKLDGFPNNEKELTMDNTNHTSVQELLEQPEDSSSSARYGFQLQRGNLSVMQTQSGTGGVEDYSMKSLFPLSSSSGTSSLMEMQSYSHDKITRMPIQSQDLGLSLHTTHQNLNHTSYGDHGGLLTNSMGFEQNYAKGEPWNNNLVGELGTYNSQTIPSSQVFGSQAFSQREPLQSNNYSHDLLHSWSDDQQNAQQPMPIHQSSLYNSIYFGSIFQGLTEIHGEQQDHSHI